MRTVLIPEIPLSLVFRPRWTYSLLALRGLPVFTPKTHGVPRWFEAILLKINRGAFGLPRPLCGYREQTRPVGRMTGKSESST